MWSFELRKICVWKGTPLGILFAHLQFCTVQLFERPLNSERWIIPNDGPFPLRVIGIGRFVEHLGGLRENEEAMGEAFGNPQHLEFTVVIPRSQMKTGPLPELGRIAAQVDGDIPDVPGEYTDELTLGLN